MGDRNAVVQGDITKQAVDAIVNAANSSLSAVPPRFA
jgi:O-acetyl-ADP-ribose deacetylase (regulator of RNase III)